MKDKNTNILMGAKCGIREKNTKAIHTDSLKPNTYAHEHDYKQNFNSIPKISTQTQI